MCTPAGWLKTKRMQGHAQDNYYTTFPTQICAAVVDRKQFSCSFWWSKDTGKIFIQLNHNPRQPWQIIESGQASFNIYFNPLIKARPAVPNSSPSYLKGVL